MSISLMSAIFKTEFRDLPLGENDRMAKASSIKLVMLAIADHANDEGESAYPGLTLLQRKTALSRQGLIDVLTACKFNGLLFVADEPSKLGTNNYQINLECLPCLQNTEQEKLLVKPLDQSSHLTSTSQATLPGVVKPLDLNHQLTINEPSKEKDLVDGFIELSKTPGIKKQIRLEGIQSRIAVALNINVSWNKWERFIRFADKQEQEHNQTVEAFMGWLKAKPGFDVGYWPPDKMQEVWPQAFENNEPTRPEHKKFVQKDDDYVPNPYS